MLLIAPLRLKTAGHLIIYYFAAKKHEIEALKSYQKQHTH